MNSALSWQLVSVHKAVISVMSVTKLYRCDHKVKMLNSPVGSFVSPQDSREPRCKRIPSARQIDLIAAAEDTNMEEGKGFLCASSLFKKTDHAKAMQKICTVAYSDV